MLRVLLESNAPRQRRSASTVASIAVHTAVIVGAIVATASAGSSVPAIGRVAEEGPIYTRPTPRRERRTTESSRTATPRRQTDWLEEAPPTVPRIPDVAIPSDEARGEIDPRQLLATDTIGLGDRRRDRRWGGDTGPTGLIGDEPATLATVERAAALLAPPKPRYPDQLRAAGVTGRVVVRLVVDTTGRVESSTVVIREASHDLFAQAVRAVLPSLRFRPAEVGGRKVRMLVDLPFEFQLHE